MIFPFRYRASTITWGIFIDLDAEDFLADDEAGDIYIAPGLWVRFAEPTMRMPAHELAFLVQGLARVSKLVPQEDMDRIVEIRGLDFAHTSFQKEGLEATIIGWAAERFGFEVPPIEISFDSEENEYVFTYGQPD